MSFKGLLIAAPFLYGAVYGYDRLRHRPDLYKFWGIAASISSARMMLEAAVRHSPPRIGANIAVSLIGGVGSTGVALCLGSKVGEAARNIR
jgi:hypothetical protein